MVIISPHAEATKKTLDLLKSLANNLDYWNFTEEKDGVKIYNNTIDSVVIVRGDATIIGHEFTSEQIACIATLPGARKICK